MSQEHIAIWNSTADSFSARYDAITDEQWAASTPCEGWTVKDLVDHAVGVQSGMVAGLVGADVAEGADWPTALEAIRAALETDGALEGTTELPRWARCPRRCRSVSPPATC